MRPQTSGEGTWYDYDHCGQNRKIMSYKFPPPRTICRKMVQILDGCCCVPRMTEWLLYFGKNFAHNNGDDGAASMTWMDGWVTLPLRFCDEGNNLILRGGREFCFGRKF